MRKSDQNAHLLFYFLLYDMWAQCGLTHSARGTSYTSESEVLVGSIYKKITPYPEKIATVFGGHIRRHLENYTFCMVRFWRTFDMLLSTPDTTINR